MWLAMVGALAWGGPLAGPVTVDHCDVDGRLRWARSVPPSDDRFDPPDADPWPGVTPGASAAAWARIADAVRSGSLPPSGAVRPEEIVQMLPPDDPPPPPGEDVVVRAEAVASPWSADEAVLRIAVTTRRPRPLDRAPVRVAVVVDARTDGDSGLRTARRAIRALAQGLRPDDTVTLVDSARGIVAPAAPVGDGAALLAAADGLVAVERDHDLPGALIRGYAALAGGTGPSRVVLLSDGDVGLVEQFDALGALASSRAGVGVGLTAVGIGTLHGRDESLEGLARAAGGTYLGLRDGDDAQRMLGDFVSSVVEPVVTDVRLVVDWGPAVVGVHRMGNHQERLSDLGPATPAGRELGAGRTAVVVYEVKLAPGAQGLSLGRVRVRSTSVRDGVPRVEALQLPDGRAPYAEASPSARLALVATELGELIVGTRPAERAPDLVALAASAQRAEYPEDAELVEVVTLAAPLLAGPRCW
ncbi:MAG: von Willebrand factor type A domain-containing protein [Myxococcota bacterium]